MADSSEEAAEKLWASERDGAVQTRLKCRRLVWILLIVCLSALGGFAIGARLQQSSTDRVCFERTSEPSPLLNDDDDDDFAISWAEVSFNGSLLKENEYRRRASPEVDAAWEALGVNYNSIIVPAEIAASVGLTKDQVQVKDKYGGGYVANVEGLHHLHCLNLLRQALHWNFKYYHRRGEGAFRNNEAIVEKHATHCLDIIRQQLQCTADVGVMGQIWYQPSAGQKPEPFVDFNTKHVCRNFDDIRQWAFTRQIREPTPDDFLEPPGAADKVYRVIP